MIDIELLDVLTALVPFHQLPKAVYLLPQVSRGQDHITTVKILVLMTFKRTHFQLTQKPSSPHSTSASAYIMKFEKEEMPVADGEFFFFFTQDYSSFLVLQTTYHVRPKSGQGRGDYGTKSRLTLQTPASLLIYK